MAIKSTIISLPIVPYNQNKHSDMCLYLEYLEDFLHKIVRTNATTGSQTASEDPKSAKDAILKDVHVPLCGDLLGRERVTGAKKMRLGCDSASDRFENIHEYPALWHSKQAFLGVCI